MDEIVGEFLVESREGLDQLDQDLVTLEQRPRDQALLGSIFRCIHTIKGTCGFLGFPTLESVAHAGENLLSLLRDGKLVLSPGITSALLRLVDAIRSILAQIEATGTEGDHRYPGLIEQLTGLQTGEAAAAQTAATASAAVAIAEAAPATVSAESSVRVDVVLLDHLMNLVGELVLARNQILQYTSKVGDAGFLPTSQRLNLITTELQAGVMKTRMQPIGNVWAKLPRVVRDLALACGKQITLEMTGQETELDRTIIEAVKDPLTHMVRNSIDHGIESPQTRAAAGKPAEGRLKLKAYHEGGQVNIEISDDGGGIDTTRVRQKAIERGLVTAEQAAQMAEREVMRLIFLPGFSTAATVSNISGRGVGMDVVRTNIEKIGGTVDVNSELGHGTTLKIRIPLTLAIIPALTITTGGDRYAIPQVNLIELVRLESTTGIERIHGAMVYRLRDRLLPLVSLNQALAIGGERYEGATIVVLRADDRSFGLVVDEVNDTEEIVVKPLGKLLKDVPLFAGATIMGDGGVALILDVVGLAQHTNVVSASRDRSRVEAVAVNAAPAIGDAARQTFLVVGLGGDRRLAIPLSVVARLEELPHDTVENAGGIEVVQYRGAILPILRMSEVLDIPATRAVDTKLQVVVYADKGRNVGLVVDCIVDIVEETITIERRARRGDLLGSAVIQGRVTDLVDLDSLVRRADPYWEAA